MEEIDLPSLTRIMNGGVRVTFNPKLCYAETVDWWRMTLPEFREKIIVSVRKIVTFYYYSLLPFP